MSYSGAIVLVSFDTLRQLVSTCLPGPILQREHIHPIDEEPAQRRRYDLVRDGTNLGAVRIERMGEYIQDLTIIPPSEPASRAWSNEEKQLLGEQTVDAAKTAIMAAVTESIVAERDALWQIILQTHQSVIAFFWERLEQELDRRESQGFDWQRDESSKPTARHYFAGRRVRQFRESLELVTGWFRRYLLGGTPLPLGVHQVRDVQRRDGLGMWAIGEIGWIEISRVDAQVTEIAGVTNPAILRGDHTAALSAIQIEEALERFIDAFYTWLSGYVGRSVDMARGDAAAIHSQPPSPVPPPLIADSALICNQPAAAQPTTSDIESENPLFSFVRRWYEANIERSRGITWSVLADQAHVHVVTLKKRDKTSI